MKYEPEETLLDKVQSGQYGWKEYIEHHSRELENEYRLFCLQEGLNCEEEESAKLFIEMRDLELEDAINNGNA